MIVQKIKEDKKGKLTKRFLYLRSIKNLKCSLLQSIRFYCEINT